MRQFLDRQPKHAAGYGEEGIFFFPGVYTDVCLMERKTEGGRKREKRRQDGE